MRFASTCACPNWILAIAAGVEKWGTERVGLGAAEYC